MAEGKRSFVLYCDLLYTVDRMPPEKAGELFKHILRYVNDKNPETDDLLIEIAFEPIKQQFKRDLKKWEEISAKRSEIGRLAGEKSGEARRTKKNQNEPIGSETKQKEHVTVNDNVTVNVSDSVKEEKKTIPQQVAFVEFWDLYEKKVDRKVCERKWSKLGYEDQCKVLSHLPGYIKSTPDKQFRKNPESYLNANAWENEILSKSGLPEKKEVEIKPNGYPNPQVYYMTCWEKKIKPVRWENGDVLSESEIEQQHKLHKVGDYQYA